MEEALYVTSSSSARIMDYLKDISGINPGYAGQKFNRLIVNGVNINGVKCEVLSAIPVNRNISKQIIWREKKECENGVFYNYIPFLNISYIHNLCLFVYSFFYVLFWGMKRPKSKFILMDVLNVSLCYGSLFACKLCGIHAVGVVTDMPGLLVDTSPSTTLVRRLAAFLNRGYIDRYDSYVLLTEHMNNVINKKNRPYIIMEGLTQSSLPICPDVINEKSERSILYAGGLHERYGLKLLINSFTSIPDPDLKLIIYGSGPFVSQILEISESDNRIDYRGVVTNEEILEVERQATLLINPRPTSEEFTLYSFPSKNIEYMTTGRPLLTTKLPGMPEEYCEYVYLITDESIEGYRQAIISTLSNSLDSLAEKGRRAQTWVIENKNNIVQTRRIINLVNSCM